VQRPFGSWPSPVGAGIVAAQGIRLSGVTLDGDDIYWLEGRPAEGGRNVLVRRTPGGGVADVVPADFNVRTRVHEYGGGAYTVATGVVYFANFTDQRIYRLAPSDRRPVPVTPEGNWFYADAVVDQARDRLICVREDHSAPRVEPSNALVSVSLREPLTDSPTVLASGYDFYSTPRLNRSATRLSWICWRHPNMPWDGTELWAASVMPNGELGEPVHVAGGAAESIYQPGWGADDRLYFVSDRDGWWRLYRFDSTIEPVLTDPPARAEFGRPAWVFGTATWAMPSPDRLVTTYVRDGRWHLATIDVATARLRDVPTNLEPLEWLQATTTHAVLVAASPSSPEMVVRIALETGRREVIQTSASTAEQEPLNSAWLSVPESIEFPSTGRGVHAFYYPPHNEGFEGLDGERPPLIVIGHGGPTTAARDTLDLRVQFWTSRGFAVADVNYSGSSGYGRAYRQRLNRQWGVADVADLIEAARFLSSVGKADPGRLIIRGGSAGGYTALAALAFHPGVFKAGASYYGISDLEVLARDTHKFESRYLDSLVGPYPEMREVYRARSPIHFVDRLACALILFQGLEDQVVPPNQSAMMADALRAKGLPVAYLTFAGEQHGFRRADTIVRCLEAELAFYAAVFGFAPADSIEPPPIDNLLPRR
jgi:dipeptidyl aminopeptidase/acylaminoacyl peptidase